MNSPDPSPRFDSPAPAPSRLRRFFGRTRLVLLLTLLVLFLLCLVFSWNTRDAMQHLPFLNRRTASGRLAADTQRTLVDLRPWQTASALAPLAVSHEEAEFAQEAERLADHEVDQAFASALRKATSQVQHATLSGDALALSQRVTELQNLVKDDKQQVQQYSPSPGNSAKANNGDPAEDTADDLEIAKAQLGLDTDQLSEAQEDLARASGDDRAQIQSELQEHEAAMKKYDSGEENHKQTAVLDAAQYSTLSSLIRAWNGQRSRRALIEEAKTQALADVAAITSEHNALQADAQAKSKTATAAASDHASKLAAIREQASQRQLLSIYNDRIQTEKQLAAVYEKWSAQVLLQRQIVQHLILGSLALIAFIILAVILCDGLVATVVDRAQARHSGLGALATQVERTERSDFDRRRMLTLRTIFQLALQVLGVVLVALVIFGSPRQMPTILGLATAGLTVVLQDFIIAFFGWFVLMGKHGIRVGDWVEINSVGGEVTEIGLFRTTLLETGNWTDRGHPTGRRVTFINSFAIRGQYFNFSTAGQWMWDQLTVSVPASEKTYAIVESIHKAVSDETGKNARVAAQEWKRGARSDGLSQFSADATVNLRPSAAGVDILVRYVTRASERTEVRNRLFQRVLDILRQPAGEPEGTVQAG